MAQDEILEILKENPTEWFISREIATITGINIQSITTNLKRLKKFELVEFKKERQKGHTVGSYFYKLKQKDLKKDKDINKEV